MKKLNKQQGKKVNAGNDLQTINFELPEEDFEYTIYDRGKIVPSRITAGTSEPLKNATVDGNIDQEL